MKLRDFVGKNVKIVDIDGVETIGWAIGYTQACDNEPEVACIDLRVPGNPYIIGFLENEITSIEEMFG